MRKWFSSATPPTLSPVNPREQAGYFRVPGAHLYTVLHGVSEPVARVLLVGPFAADRHFSYVPWVRWARYLAARKVQCLRYDYRGIGESTGAFEDMSFDNWVEDVDLLARWLKSRTPAAPLVLHGLELGAVLAGHVFETGLGDAWLSWAPPPSANQALRATLLRRIATDNMFKYGADRKPLSDYLARLESGEYLEVDGYRWSSKLWRDSFRYDLAAGAAHGRPTRTVTLDKSATPLVKGSPVGYETITRDFNELFGDNFAWIVKSLGPVE